MQFYRFFRKITRILFHEEPFRVYAEPWKTGKKESEIDITGLRNAEATYNPTIEFVYLDGQILYPANSLLVTVSPERVRILIK